MSQTQSRNDASYGMPRWVKVFGIIALILILILGILHFSGEHGPGSHMTSMEMNSGTPSASMMTDMATPSGNGGWR